MSQLTDYSVNDTPMLMDIRSDTLEPISGVQGTSRRFVFRLDQAGYLDSNSMLLFKLQGLTNNDNRVNQVNGGLGAIKRCTFQVGDFVINDVDGANMISTLMNLTTQPPSVKNQFNGWYYQNCLHHSVLEGADTTQLGGFRGGTTIFARWAEQLRTLLLVLILVFVLFSIRLHTTMLNYR